MTEGQRLANIPNLSSLTLPKITRGKGRGKIGSTSGTGTLRSEKSEVVEDRILQQTDEDASVSRLSAVSLRYLEDPFAEIFAGRFDAVRRYPIINRGTYIRTHALDRLIDAFVLAQPDEPKQIISLGAGSDTRYFRIVTSNPSLDIIYHEIDFPRNTASKISIIKHTPALLKALSKSPAMLAGDAITISADGRTLTSPNYNIHALDLRDLADPQTLPNLPNLSQTAPTLILSECCLCYLPPATTTSILTTITNRLLPPTLPVGVVIYEPVSPHDSFGKVMQQNLAQRGIHLQTLLTYHSLSLQKQRLLELGFTGGQRAADVDWIFENDDWVSQEERERVAKCEMMDEVEEWRLLAKHYCVVWGWRGEDREIWERAWGRIGGQPDGD